MAEKPIIFSAPMVRALLDGRKTQTRRAIKPTPDYGCGGNPRAPQNWHDQEAWGWEDAEEGCWRMLSEGYTGRPHYAKGMRLYVREAFCLNPAVRHMDRSKNLIFRADVPDVEPPLGDVLTIERATWVQAQGLKWKPSIHMPRWASRLTLTVTDVRVQRLQEISGEDCIAEGADCETCAASWSVGRSACNQRGCFEIRRNFHELWNSLHGPDAWDANPWVCAISFAVHRCNIDQMEQP